MKPKIHFRETLNINAKGHLEIGGADCTELASAFGTPLYVYDEAYIRTMMRTFRDVLRLEYGGNGDIFYASKAFSCEAIYAIARQEDIGADVVSGGELYTAMQAGFPAERICMHGNNKLPAELSYALSCGVGSIVVDALSEAERIEAEAERRGIVQDVLLRINPGIEAHTHAYVQTARADSKFGFSIDGGAAEDVTKRLLAMPHLRLRGFHCHIGSQIFESRPYFVAVEKCLDWIAHLKRATGFEADSLNLGGGFSVWYAEGDRQTDAEGYRNELSEIVRAVAEGCRQRGLAAPRLYFEPGRAIVGEAGITLYTVGAIKDIKGVRKYLAVDGGMFENPRFCLYGSKYTALLANRATDPPEEIVSIAGKCCESGDLIGTEFNLPAAKVGDLVAVFTTGAYHYSMASNYNRNPVPPVVLVRDGEAEYIVRPQTYEDLVRRDALPERLR